MAACKVALSFSHEMLKLNGDKAVAVAHPGYRMAVSCLRVKRVSQHHSIPLWWFQVLPLLHTIATALACHLQHHCHEILMPGFKVCIDICESVELSTHAPKVAALRWTRSKEKKKIARPSEPRHFLIRIFSSGFVVIQWERPYASFCATKAVCTLQNSRTVCSAKQAIHILSFLPGPLIRLMADKCQHSHIILFSA